MIRPFPFTLTTETAVDTPSPICPARNKGTCPGFQKGRASIFKKGIFSTVFDDQKCTTNTVISTFYQYFDDYFCDGHLFHSSLFICLTIDYNKLMPNCFYFWGRKYFFCLVA